MGGSYRFFARGNVGFGVGAAATAGTMAGTTARTMVGTTAGALTGALTGIVVEAIRGAETPNGLVTNHVVGGFGIPEHLDDATSDVYGGFHDVSLVFVSLVLVLVIVIDAYNNNISME